MVQFSPNLSARDNRALDSLFHALADPTRRAMLQSLAIGNRNIGELAAPHRMSFAAASKHVRVLEAAGLVKRQVEGRSHICRLEPSAMRAAERWIADRRATWEGHLHRLGEFLDAQDREQGGSPARKAADYKKAKRSKP